MSQLMEEGDTTSRSSFGDDESDDDATFRKNLFGEDSDSDSEPEQEHSQEKEVYAVISQDWVEKIEPKQQQPTKQRQKVFLERYKEKKNLDALAKKNKEFCVPFSEFMDNIRSSLRDDIKEIQKDSSKLDSIMEKLEKGKNCQSTEVERLLTANKLRKEKYISIGQKLDKLVKRIDVEKPSLDKAIKDYSVFEETSENFFTQLLNEVNSYMTLYRYMPAQQTQKGKKKSKEEESNSNTTEDQTANDEPTENSFRDRLYMNSILSVDSFHPDNMWKPGSETKKVKKMGITKTPGPKVPGSKGRKRKNTSTTPTVTEPTDSKERKLNNDT